MSRQIQAAMGILLCALNAAHGADVILNEYNAVSADRLLDNDQSDVFFGRSLGNGGNWFELVVTGDRVDMRGWQLVWKERPADEGVLTLTDDPLWSDMRAGTIVTFTEQDTAAGGLDTDVTFDPNAGDWWININTLAADGTPHTQYVTTTTNVAGDGPGNFSVGNNKWQLTLLDADGNVAFGPAGELDELPKVGVNNQEVFKLEEDPGRDIHPTISRYRDGTSSTFGHPNLWGGGDEQQDFTCLRCYDDDPCTVDACDGGICTFSADPQCNPPSGGGGGGGGAGGGGGPVAGGNDADGDGVANEEDACPETFVGETVDAGGCSCSQLDCDDGIDCTVDTCRDAKCAHADAADTCPDDGLFCNGREGCDPDLDCTSTGAPCDAGTFCNEDTDTCDPCVDEDQCDDGGFCNGAEFCDPALGCLSPGDPCPAGTRCDELTDACIVMDTQDNGTGQPAPPAPVVPFCAPVGTALLFTGLGLWGLGFTASRGRR